MRLAPPPANVLLRTIGIAEQEGLKEDLARLICALTSERDRDVIRMYFFEELGIQDIAMRLGIPADRVSVVKRRALDRLRHLFTSEIPQRRDQQ